VLTLIARAFSESEPAPGLDLVALREERERLETELSRKPAEQSPMAPIRTRVQDALQEGEALLDLYLHEATGGDPEFLAFVITRHSPLELVELGSAPRLEQAIERHRKEFGSELTELLWRPLEHLLKPCHRVHVCPEGPLAMVSFETLAGEDRFLIEDFSFVYLQSATQLLDPAEAPGDGALIVGGVNYDQATPGRPLPGENADPSGLRSNPLEGSPWRPLPGTALEAEWIARIWEETEPTVEVRLLLGSAASEAQVKSDCAGKRYLHLATHGYFADSLEKSSPVASWAPALLTGLVFAGANQRSSGPGQDGLLSAAEVLWLDLTGCELVTLSACHTGLGAVRTGEQLMGLRRALHLAGARSTVTSLWEVEDAVTQALMREFYRRLWVDGEAKADALRGAQLSLLERSRRRLDGDPHPEDWGAFVLEGDGD